MEITEKLKREVLREIMRERGSKTSPAKAAAARKNGKLGGRPKDSKNTPKKHEK